MWQLHSASIFCACRASHLAVPDTLLTRPLCSRADVVLCSHGRPVPSAHPRHTRGRPSEPSVQQPKDRCHGACRGRPACQAAAVCAAEPRAEGALAWSAQQPGMPSRWQPPLHNDCCEPSRSVAASPERQKQRCSPGKRDAAAGSPGQPRQQWYSAGARGARGNRSCRLPGQPAPGWVLAVDTACAWARRRACARRSRGLAGTAAPGGSAAGTGSTGSTGSKRRACSFASCLFRRPSRGCASMGHLPSPRGTVDEQPRGHAQCA